MGLVVRTGGKAQAAASFTDRAPFIFHFRGSVLGSETHDLIFLFSFFCMKWGRWRVIWATGFGRLFEGRKVLGFGGLVCGTGSVGRRGDFLERTEGKRGWSCLHCW